MTETLPLKLNWLRCPRCGGKTRTQLRPHTVLEDFPLFLPEVQIHLCDPVSEWKNRRN